MPIYAYRCTSCGHAQDVLQRISDPLLTVCPSCSASTFAKQVTAAGFQLKGSGWYVTDFRGGNNAAAKKDEGVPAAADAAAGKAGDAAPVPAADGKAAAPAATPAPAPAVPAPSPAPSGGGTAPS